MNKKLTLLAAGLALGTGMALAQTQVHGKVTSSEDGQPVIGATVLVDGTKNGTVTDANGNFTLNAPAGAKLRITYLGMTPQVVTAGRNVSVRLEADHTALDEVLVVAYGTTKKSAYTGAASEIKAAKIEDRQISNVSAALVGTMAGVQTIQTNGQPGQDVTIRVRGISSINGVNSPLYVVDGVPFDGDLSSINSQDIASMTVLKDAISTSLYGSRGSNGVVMITTKKGQLGQTKITVDAKWGAVTRENKNYDVMTSTAEYYETLYKAYYNAYTINNGYSADRAYRMANADMANTGYTVYTVPEGQYLIGSNGKLNPYAKLGYTDGEYYYAPESWEDETFKTTMRQEYNVGISGATDNFSYYTSFNYLQDDGTIKGSGFDRLTARANLEYKAKPWLTIGSNMAYTHTVSYTPDDQDDSATASSANAFRMANAIAPVYPFYVHDAQGNIMHNSATGENVYDYGDGSSTNFTRNFMSMGQPIGSLVYDNEEYNMDIFKGNWFARADLTHGFTATARIGLDVDNTLYKSYGNMFYGQNAQYGGTVSNEHLRTTALTHQYLLNYQNAFGKHNLTATAGFEGYRLKYQYFYGSGQELYKGGDHSLGNATSQHRIGGQLFEYHTAGWFFTGNYNYDERFFVNLGYRRDGTSAFAPENRWGNFYSFGLGWNMKKEAWLADFDALDQLKVRASFGQTGNDNHNYSIYYYGWYAYQDVYQMTGSDGSFSDGTLRYKGNPDLQWEKTNSFDLGVDYSFWKGRLHGSLDFYFRATSNLLDFKKVAISNGYTQIPVNMGTVQNYGLELEASYDIIRKKDLTWNVALNGTWQKNRIHKLSAQYDDGQYIDAYRIYKEGESIYNLYLVEWAGVNHETGEAQYVSVKLGDDGTPVTDENGNYVEEVNTDLASAYTYNRKQTGSILPKFFGGLSTSLEWKGLDFSVQTSFQLGGRVYDAGYDEFMDAYDDGSLAGRNFHRDLLNAWTEDNKDSDIPRLDAADKNNTYWTTRFLVSSNYLSIDNITLGYTLPKSLFGKLGVEGIRIFCSAENVALFSKRQGLDPRLSLTSVSSSWYGARRTISGGIKLTF